MYSDIGIKRNGNLLRGSNGSLVIKNGNSWVDQLIYRVLMDADASTFTGLANGTRIVEAVREYLRGRIGTKLPFPFERIQLTISKNDSQTWSLSLSYPSVDGGSASITMPLKQREGFVADISYDFQPYIADPNPTVRVQEIIRTETISNRVPLGFLYSGVGPVRIFQYDSFDGNIFEEEEIIITKVPNKVKYNLYDYISDNEDLKYTIDDVFVKVNQYIESEDGTGYTIIDGTPFVFFNSETPDGTTVTATIRKSKSAAVANEVIVEEEELQYRPQPMKMSKEKHIAILTNPLSVGTYIAIYNASINNNRYPL